MSLVWHLLKISISLTSEASFKHVSFEDALNISEDIKSEDIKLISQLTQVILCLITNIMMNY